jgi:hypothetical protein
MVDGIKRSALGMVGSILLTAISVGAAVGPAHAVERAAPALAAAQVSGQAQA